MKRFLFFCLATLFAVTSWAQEYNYDFYAVNSDGVTIYYSILDESAMTVEVANENRSIASTYTGEVNIPETASYEDETFDVVGIGNTAFWESSITRVTIPNTVTSIGDYAFENCTSLTEIEIPNSVTSIGISAFTYCSNLAKVTLSEKLESISNNMFSYCTSLASIDIPSSVTSIGSEAFYLCSALTEIKIPDSVTSIGGIAFEYCSSLEEITIPSGVTIISSGMLSDCSSLVKVVLSEGVTEIQDNAFDADYYLEDINLPSTLTTIGNWVFNECDEGLAEITIPANVTSIGQGAFADCSSLKTINYNAKACSDAGDSLFPAFTGCTNVNVVNIGEGVTIIPAYLCKGFKNLTSITLPESVESIGAGVFAVDGRTACGVTEITSLPTTPPTCADDSFTDDIISWGTLYVPCDSQDAYTSVEPWKNFETIVGLNCVDETIKFQYDGLYYQTVSSTEVEVTYEGSWKSDGSSYSGSITVPESVTYNDVVYNVIGIGEYAFYQCPSMSSVSLPNTIQYIDQYAFAYDSQNESPSLTTIEIPESVTSIGVNAFQYCTSLTSVTLPSGITEIPTSAFDRNSLTSIEIPEGVTAIGVNAFRACPLTDGVTCYAVEPPVCTVQTGLSKQTPFTNVSISSLTLYVPSGSEDAYGEAEVWEDFGTIEAIGGSSEGTPLEKWAKFEVDGVYYQVTDSDNREVEVTSEEEPWEEFGSYTGDITIPATVTYENVEYTVVGVGEAAFWYSEKLTSVSLPSSLTYFGEYAFNACFLLKEITIPAALTTLSEAAISECYALETIKVEEGNTSFCVEDGVLYTMDKTSLIQYPVASSATSFVIPEEVEYVEVSAFAGSQNLTEVTIASTVTYIKLDAFWYCENLVSIYSLNTTPPETDNVIFYTSGPNWANCVLYVPEGCVDSYASTKVWKDFKTIKEIGDEPLADGDTFDYDGIIYKVVSAEDQTVEVTYYGDSYSADEAVAYYTGDINIPASFEYRDATYTVIGVGDYAFYKSGVTSITFDTPSNVTYLGTRAMYNCTAITELELPEGVLTVGDQSLRQCTSMTTLKLPETVTYLGEYLCWGNTALKAINIPSSVTTLGKYVFYNCSAATELTLSPNITEWGGHAFYDCEALTHVDIPEGITEVGEYAFSNCDGLVSISIPDEVTTLGAHTFAACSKLESCVLPESMTEVDGYLFYNCPSMTEVTIGSKVESFGSSVFAGCPDLTAIYSLNPTPPSIPSSTFGSGPSGVGSTDKETCVLYVPCGSEEDYASADYWSAFSNIVGYDCPNEGGVPDGYIITPAEGEVESLSVITVDSEDGMGEGSGFYTDATKAEFKVVNNETGETVATLGNWEVMLDETTYHTWIEITLSNEVSVAGSYTVTIPAGAFLDKTTYDSCPAFTLSYTIVPAVSYEIVVDPESGSTLESLSEFTITCEDGLSLNSWDPLYVKKDDVVVAHAWGDDPVWANDGSVLGFIFTICDPDTEADLTLTDAGEYTIEVPEGYFLYDNESESEGFTIVYTIEEALTFSDFYSLEPEEGVVESLSHVKFTPLEGAKIAWSEKVDVDQVKVYKDGDTTTAVAYGASVDHPYSGSYDEYDEIFFNVTLSDPGEYEVVFPYDSFVYNNNGRTSCEEFSLHYTIEDNRLYTIEPEEGVVESLSYVKFIAIGNIAYAEVVEPEEIKVYKDGDTSSPVAYGVDINYAFKGIWDEYDEIVFNTELTDPGEYSVVIPEAFLALGDWFTYSEEMTLNYTIVDNSWGTPAGYILDPADGDVVETLSTIIASYDGGSLAAYDAAVCGHIQGTVLSKTTGQQVASVKFEGAWDENTQTGYVVCTLTEEVSEPGTYYVTFPKHVFYDYENWTYNSEFTVTYYVTGLPSVTEYTFDPEDGSTMASLSEFTVGFADGIDCSWNYSGEITVTDEYGNVVAHDYDCETNYPEDDPWGDGLSCTITLDTEITAAGKYTISIPEGYFLVATSPYWDDSEALTITYYVDESAAVEPGTFVCVVDPADGSDDLTELAQVAFYNPTDGEEIFVNDELARDPEIYVYDEAGNVVTSISYFDTYFGKNWEEYAQIVVFEDAVEDEGTYTVSVPAEMFIIYDESGRAYYSEAMTLTYTVVGNGEDTGIRGISINDENVEGIYSTNGQKLNSTVKGVNIIRYSDGSVKKLYVK